MSTKTIEVATSGNTNEARVRSSKRLATGVRAGGLVDDWNSPFRRPMPYPEPRPEIDGGI